MTNDEADVEIDIGPLGGPPNKGKPCMTNTDLRSEAQWLADNSRVPQTREMAAAITRVLDELDAARKALKPFADAADKADVRTHEYTHIPLATLRAARSALKGGE